MSLGSKKSATNTTSQNIDNRVVNDASGAGTADNGSIATTVQGSNNTVTDSGAFAIVDKLVSQIGQVASAQTNVARDIALRDTAQGTIYAQRAVEAQNLAAQENELKSSKYLIFAGIGALAIFYIARQK